ncbi:MAG: hypothetical protein Q7S40_31355 [Opitutaceae bacterium]|nr:hypothetical protein [Opitutaceae bacterium]
MSKMSKTPSWVMLGFVLGAMFVLALPERKAPPAPTEPPKAAEPAAAPVPRDPPPLSNIEAVFEVWGKHAVWHDDTTEVALWDPTEKRYADFYEVRRFSGTLYFRSIPNLTRRVIERGSKLADSPLLFTETEEQFREWDERDRERRPIERMWRPPPPKLPSVEPKAPATNMPAPEVQRIVPPPWETTKPVIDTAKK